MRCSRPSFRLVARGVSPDHNYAVLGLTNLNTVQWGNTNTTHIGVGGFKQPYMHERTCAARCALDHGPSVVMFVHGRPRLVARGLWLHDVIIRALAAGRVSTTEAVYLQLCIALMGDAGRQNVAIDGTFSWTLMGFSPTTSMPCRTYNHHHGTVNALAHIGGQTTEKSMQTRTLAGRPLHHQSRWHLILSMQS